jgi:hypothetical protein
MKNLNDYLNEGQRELPNIKGFVESLGIPFYKNIKKKTVGYIEEGKKKIKLVLYVADRLTVKDQVENILNSNRIDFKDEKKSDSSLNATVIGKGKDEIVIIYKPMLGSGGSGAGSDQTALQETAQAIFLSLAFNVTKKKLDVNDITKDNLIDAYQYVDTNDFPVMEILAFTENKKWLSTFLNTTNMIFKKYYNSSKSYTFERGSELIKKIYKDYQALSKAEKITAKDDKWNPADIWMISNTMTSLPDSNSLQDLNSFVFNKFESKDLIGISLKKLSTNPKITVYNLAKGDGRKEYDKYVISPNSKDVYIYTTDGSKVQFRSFNALGSYQGEIKGQKSNQGKIGYEMFNYFLTKNGNNKLPKAQVEVKQLVQSQDKTFLLAFADLWNKYIKNELENEQDVIEYAKKNSKEKFEDFIFSKYISLLIVDTLSDMTDEAKSSFITDVFGYASSSTDFSSVFLKVA